MKLKALDAVHFNAEEVGKSARLRGLLNDPALNPTR